MLFQALDYKQFCRLFYMGGELHTDFDPQKMTKTWQYSGHLEGQNVEYATLYCKGRSVDDMCPKHLQEKWIRLRKKKMAYMKSLKIAHIDISDVCIYELLPWRFLKEYCETKNKITQYVLNTHSRPTNYNFYKELTEVLLDISRNPLYINDTSYNNINIKYNIFGTRTGRLTTFKNSFPILTLKKESRNIIEPENMYFLELDYNSAELRVMYALQRMWNDERVIQPQEDMHEWNIRNIFNGMSRDEAKKAIFAWLYNPSSRNDLAEQFYNRKIALKMSNWNGSSIKNYFERRIDVDERRAVNYLLQSTLSDLFLRKKIKIYKMLKGRASRIAFSVHDSLVIDMSLEDTDIVQHLVEEFADTPFGKFKVNVNVGKNYGNLRKARGF